MKKISIIVCALMLFLFLSVKKEIQASSSYQVVEYDNDGNQKETIQSFSTYEEANRYRRSLGRNKNYAVVLDNEILSINYGVVNMNTSDSAMYNNYSMVEGISGASGYTNGVYAADALYLGTNEVDKKISIRLAGANFYLNKQNNGFEAEILPYSSKLALSRYRNENGALKHFISTNVHKFSTYGIEIGPAPEFMKQGETYYSYDGHYFYTDYKVMVNDLISDHFKNAVNANQPYYNYYQFLPYRSQTNYTVNDFKVWFYDKLEYHLPYFYGGEMRMSILNTTEQAFLDSQNQFGANALLTYGIAKNESADGYSNIAQSKLNLFGHGAVDSSPYAGANRYHDNSSSIYEHALNFISKGYAHSDDWRYFGSHVGDKASGLNVKYASDPYWGEKAAANYYRFDRALGLKDYKYYTIGIQKDNEDIKAYANIKDDNPIYSLESYLKRPFVIIAEINHNNEKWYKVHPDTPINTTRSGKISQSVYDGKYDFEKQYVYIKENQFEHVILGTKSLKDTNSTEVVSPPTTLEKNGDINGDGNTDLSDMMMIYRHIKNIKLVTGKQFTLADINNDSTVDLRDMMMIYRHIKGIKFLR